MKTYAVFIALLFAVAPLPSQTLSTRYERYGALIDTQLSTAPFPHPQRANGHMYDSTLYSAAEHYSDSSVAIFIPKGFRKTGSTDFVVHFHGWNNNIDSVFAQYRLIEQFAASRKNAILVVPQGPRNAPDSFGGKLEDKNGFKKFMTDIVKLLIKEKKIRTAKIGNIVLSGHSGGYHVISFILMRGGLTKHIKEVYLFDALYGETEKFVYWFTHQNGKLIDIYTQNGGTKGETESLIEDLNGWNIPHLACNEADASPRDLQTHRLVFLFSPLVHNEVVSAHNNFEHYLEASLLRSK
ncbi:MAG: hypothetical protein KGJ59_01370 [Bacteroidota bacterium]|nr:hypothetical protein [Bacteroidota bacterium]